MSTATKPKPQTLVPDILPLEQVIDNTLQTNNVTEKVIAELKERYGKVRLKNINDRESYLEVKKCRNEVRKVGILAEKICEAGRSDAVKTQRLWIAKEKEILAKINEVQAPLDEDIKKFEDEELRVENEAKQKREEAFINRQATLSKYGATYINGSFVLQEISYEANLIKDADEETLEQIIVTKYKAVYERVEAKRVEEEQARKDEADRIAKAQADLELQQQQLREQQEAFEKQKSEAEAVLRQQQEQKEQAEREAAQKLIQHRAAVLTGLGMIYKGTDYYYENIVVTYNEILFTSNSDWIQIVGRITPLIAKSKEEKQALERKTAAAVARVSILQELGFTEIPTAVILSEMSATDWDNCYNGYKKTYDKKKQDEWIAEQNIKKQQQEELQKAELDKANDKDKWSALLIQIQSTFNSDLTFKSSIYKNKYAIAKEKIEEIQNL